MGDLLECRKEIDEIDAQILELFQRRMGVSMQIATYKKHNDKKVFDVVREEEKLARLRQMVNNDFERQCVTELFSQIMSMSRKLQYSMLTSYENEVLFDEVEQLDCNNRTKVAYFGTEGSYTQQAMESYFGTEVSSFPESTFQSVMEALKSGKAEYGVLPIENTSTGGITDIYDLLAQYDNYIVGEYVMKVEHALLGLPGASIEELETIYSHPQGMLQCKKYLKLHTKIKCEECLSTSHSAKRVQEEQDKTKAAIASKRAATYYGLEVLQEAINYEDNNSTRFIIVTNQRIYLKEAKKISICFVAPHISGSLYHMLSHIIFNGLNMSKIESRPLEGKKFEYRFFVDFEGNLNSPAVKNTLNGIYEEAMELKVLGNYSER